MSAYCQPTHYGDRQAPVPYKVQPVCDTPTLVAIVNPNGLGDYTVDWDDISGAVSYILQEDDNALFTSPTVVYTGAASTFNIVGNADGTWYYRVMAECDKTDSTWSDTESTIVETFDLYISGTGDDVGGDGSLGNPYATLGYALTVVTAGQKIGVLDGTYQESLLYLNAANHVGVSIKAVPGHAPVFTASHLYTVWAKTLGQTNVYEAAYVSATCNNVWNGTTRLTLVANVGACDVLTNSYYFDDPGNLLYVNIGGAAPVSIAADDTGSAVLNIWRPNCTVSGLTFQWGRAFVAVYAIPSAAGLVLEDCKFYCHRSVPGSYPVLIRDEDVTVRNCEFDYLDYDTTWAIVFGAAAADQCVISDCTITACYYGIYIDATGTGGEIANNVIGPAKFDGISVEAAQNMEVHGNRIFDFVHGGIIFNGASAPTGTIHHNVLFATAAAGTINWAIVLHTTADVSLYHNTIANLTRGTGGQQTAILYTPVAGAPTFTARNNIIKSTLAGHVMGGGTPVLDIDYSGLFDNVADYFLCVGGGHDQAGDPLFTDEATNDYTLQVASPCKDTGVFVAGISEFGPPTDIGRYET